MAAMKVAICSCALLKGTGLRRARSESEPASPSSGSLGNFFLSRHHLVSSLRFVLAGGTDSLGLEALLEDCYPSTRCRRSLARFSSLLRFVTLSTCSLVKAQATEAFSVH